MISLHEIASAFSKPSEHRFASLFQFNPVQNKLLGFFLFRLLFCFRLYLFDTLWIILSLRRLEAGLLAHVSFCNASHWLHLSLRPLPSKLGSAVLTSVHRCALQNLFLEFSGLHYCLFVKVLSVAVGLSAAATILSISCHFLSVNNFFNYFLRSFFFS